MIFVKKKKRLGWCDDAPEDRVISIFAGCLANHDRAHSHMESEPSPLTSTDFYVSDFAVDFRVFLVCESSVRSSFDKTVMCDFKRTTFRLT
jgi:hypothetical protein